MRARFTSRNASASGWKATPCSRICLIAECCNTAYPATSGGDSAVQCVRDAERRSAGDLHPESASTLIGTRQVEPPIKQLVVTRTKRRPCRPAVVLRRAPRLRHAEQRPG